MHASTHTCTHACMHAHTHTHTHTHTHENTHTQSNNKWSGELGATMKEVCLESRPERMNNSTESCLPIARGQGIPRERGDVFEGPLATALCSTTLLPGFRSFASACATWRRCSPVWPCGLKPTKTKASAPRSTRGSTPATLSQVRWRSCNLLWVAAVIILSLHHEHDLCWVLSILQACRQSSSSS